MNRFAAIGLLVLAAAAAGCNIVGPLALMIEGPPKKNAAFLLNPDRTTLIFVDDPSNRLPTKALRVEIAQTATQILLSEGALKEARDPQDAVRGTAKDRYGDLTSIAEVGAGVGAEVVVYVRMVAFQLTGDGVSFSPMAAATVKVMDVTNQKRLWPAEYEGAELKVQMRETQGEAPKTLSERAEVSRRLAQEFGKGVAQFFYEHEIRDKAGKR